MIIIIYYGNAKTTQLMIPAMFVLAWLVVMVNGCMMLGLGHMGRCPTAQADIPTPGLLC